MKKLLPILLVCAFSCNQPNTELQTEIQDLKTQLAEIESAYSTAQTDETGFIHTVFFWLKEGVSEEQKTDFWKNGLTALKEISSLYKVYIGPPAMTPREEVVDNSYDFALVCHFKDRAGHDLYQDDPIHLKFIEDYKHLWERVQVYDNLLAE